MRTGNPSDISDTASKTTYNTGDSLVVTDPTTNPALTSLTMGERTGSRVLSWLWSYVLGQVISRRYMASCLIWA
jgi:hypothetical protein